jgi:beta-glucanase (GH16 family)
VRISKKERGEMKMINKEEWINQIKKEWKLTFSDDFEGKEIDWTKWSYCPEEPRVNGACYWSNQEAFLDGEGHLVLQVSEREGTYYAGAIRTLGKFEQKQGYFEIRCQLQKEEGFWGALWLFSQTVFDVTEDGRNGTEIDIMESAHKKTGEITHTLHWNGYGEFHQQVPFDVYAPQVYEGFHVFALEWTEDEYIFYVDNHETWRSKAGGVSQAPSYIKLSVEVGEWSGDIKKANLPDAMIIDYVKAYEK